ncbi:cupin domain-containing protein [Aurantibacillus circumpalustris]|uniref:cupin domain-containing protein n=1 Tax=Aurantibacillus circumpalustris TaxID=3036359 RepID=UPI00295BBB0A|nr:cupin domain-containing protein [Aurantibacillus circumpalustris]
MTVNYLIKKLELLPHPEGGYYKETYRSDEKVAQIGLPDRFTGERTFATAIYFLIEKDNFSALHKIKSDETWHFYYGDALEVIEIDDQGNITTTHVGQNLKEGEVFQYTVKANTWFGSRVKEGGSFSLVGCTVAPGFDFEDFEMANRNELVKEFPQHKKLIEEMTR